VRSDLCVSGLREGESCVSFKAIIRFLRLELDITVVHSVFSSCLSLGGLDWCSDDKCRLGTGREEDCSRVGEGFLSDSLERGGVMRFSEQGEWEWRMAFSLVARLRS
jgi:hypothetical protein